MRTHQTVLRMQRAVAFALVLVGASIVGGRLWPTRHGVALAESSAAQSESLEDKAKRVHQSALVIDTHMDTTLHFMRPDWRFSDRHPSSDTQVDLPRLKDGGVGAVFFSLVGNDQISGAAVVKNALEQLDALHQLVESMPQELVLCTTAAQVRAVHRDGKLAVLIGVEGGHMIDDSVPVLRDYARLGARYLTLTHFFNTTWADSSTDRAAHNGLTDFGKDIVRELNRLGVMVDISHVSDKTFWDALEVSAAPLLASHSSSRALANHPRNMSDEMIKALAAKGGVVNINYHFPYLDNSAIQASEAMGPELRALDKRLYEQYPKFDDVLTRVRELNAFREARLPTISWTRIVDHIEHVARIAGVDHVGLGSDFDGAIMPDGMKDCSQLPKITQELLRRGFSEVDVKKILVENVLRVMEQTERVSQQLQTRRGGKGH